MSTPETAIPREIEDLHRFFQDWFHGAAMQRPETLARFGDVMAADFEIIGPGGQATPRAALIQAIDKAHAVHRDIGFRIWIEDIRVRSLGPGLWLATYQEWQQEAVTRRGRLSTAVFQERAGAPNGVVWRHVHETWLSDSAE